MNPSNLPLLSQQADELLISQEPHEHGKPTRWIQLVAWFLIAFATLWLIADLVAFGWLAFPSWRVDALKFWTDLGQAAAGPVALLSLGAVIFSFGYLYQQLKLQRDANVQRSMPIVIAKPRLTWRPRGIRSDGVIQIKALHLCVSLRNMGDSAATNLEVKVSDIQLVSGSNSAPVSEVSGFRNCIIECLGTAHETGTHPRDDDEDLLCIDLELPPACAGVINSVLRPKADEVRLVAQVQVRFQTITRGRFSSCALASWSSQDCSKVGGSHQMRMIQRWKDALSSTKNMGFDDLIKLGENFLPLAPGLQPRPCSNDDGAAPQK